MSHIFKTRENGKQADCTYTNAKTHYMAIATVRVVAGVKDGLYKWEVCEQDDDGCPVAIGEGREATADLAKQAAHVVGINFQNA